MKSKTRLLGRGATDVASILRVVADDIDAGEFKTVEGVIVLMVGTNGLDIAGNVGVELSSAMMICALSEMAEGILDDSVPADAVVN